MKPSLMPGTCGAACAGSQNATSSSVKNVLNAFMLVRDQQSPFGPRGAIRYTTAAAAAGLGACRARATGASPAAAAIGRIATIAAVDAKVTPALPVNAVA